MCFLIVLKTTHLHYYLKVAVKLSLAMVVICLQLLLVLDQYIFTTFTLRNVLLICNAKVITTKLDVLIGMMMIWVLQVVVWMVMHSFTILLYKKIHSCVIVNVTLLRKELHLQVYVTFQEVCHIMH